MMTDTPTVLLVDDRVENLLALEAVLDSLQIRLEKASDADGALRFLLDNEAALILMDVEMPDITGFEAARLIRQRPRCANIPIIFITARNSDEASIVEGYELGAVDYITKPFQPDILRWKVSVFVELYRSRQRERLLAEEHASRIHAEAAMRRSRLIADASAALASSMDEDRILEALANCLVPEFADRGEMFRSSGEGGFGLRLTALFPKDQPLPQGDGIIQSPEDPVRKAFDRGTSLVIEGQSGLLLPLCGPRKVLGVLALYRTGTQTFNDADRLVAEDLSERITLAMTNVALYRASEQANRAKDQFLAIASHELRTPLVSIVGWASILLSKPMKPDALEKGLRVIQKNAKLQNNLIGDILDFSRIAEQRLSLDLQPVDLRETVEHSLDTIRPLADEKGVRLNSDISNAPATVEGDPMRLQQLLTNLLSNAVKFTPKNGTITVGLDRTSDSARIIVKDTGIGIPAEFLPRIFDPFVQEDSSSTRSYSGLGLGLAIVRRLVELHNGQIQVESAGRGHGATFTVTLPVKLAGVKTG